RSLCTAVFSFYSPVTHPALHSFPTRRSSDLLLAHDAAPSALHLGRGRRDGQGLTDAAHSSDLTGRFRSDNPLDHVQQVERPAARSEEHTSELQSPYDLVCRLLLEKKKHHCSA